MSQAPLRAAHKLAGESGSSDGPANERHIRTDGQKMIRSLRTVAAAWESRSTQSTEASQKQDACLDVRGKAVIAPPLLQVPEAHKELLAELLAVQCKGLLKGVKRDLHGPIVGFRK